MKIISRAMLRRYWEQHPETESILKDWERKTKTAHWRRAQDVLNDFPRASPIAEDRIYFRVGPTRLIVTIWYNGERVWLKWLSDKKDVRTIDPKTV